MDIDASRSRKQVDAAALWSSAAPCSLLQTQLQIGLQHAALMRCWEAPLQPAGMLQCPVAGELLGVLADMLHCVVLCTCPKVSLCVHVGAENTAMYMSCCSAQALPPGVTKEGCLVVVLKQKISDEAAACHACAKPSLRCKLPIAPDPIWCRLQTILKRPGAYEALRGTEDECEDTDQEGAHLLAPELSTHQEGTDRGSSAQPGQHDGLSHGLGGTSQLEIGSWRSQQAGPSSGLKAPAAPQGPGMPMETLEHLPEVSVLAPNPVDAELRAGHMAAALQVGSPTEEVVDGLVTSIGWSQYQGCPMWWLQNGHRQSRLCRCTVAASAVVADGVKCF